MVIKKLIKGIEWVIDVTTEGINFLTWFMLDVIVFKPLRISDMPINYFKSRYFQYKTKKILKNYDYGD